jgi:hypothetical protein
LEPGPILYWTATVWALFGGAVIIGDALYQRAQARREQGNPQQPPPETDEE